ncbi:MAG: NADPH-dependent glutamate synthase [Nitrososphaerota archaeon]|jgi:glutamate synthase (NADPH/NADH) small chain|nr:NADPH-dependent glutamate synthase [Nitrososphaerota archaeon]
MSKPLNKSQSSQNRFTASVDIQKQEPHVRVKNFKEVVLGYTEEQALAEASRCLHCLHAQCIKGCPVGINIPEFIKYITQKNYKAAIAKIKEKNSLPAICGRVCPQEEQCQKLCILNKKGDPVSIGRLERYVADVEREKDIKIPQTAAVSNAKKVAVIGAGPAGLTVAADLAKLGYSVELFEALHTEGGVLVYGIPEFRLPKSIVKAEVDYIEKLGVKLTPNALIGRLFTIDDLFKKGFKAIFIGTGAGLPKLMKIPGENLNGVYSANEFLIRVNLMKAYMFPKYKTPIGVGKKVVVIGGGNVALDAARSAIRLGTEKVYLMYRRGKDEMPAREEEILNAQEEGIEFKLLTAPTKIIGNEHGRVTAIEYITMALSEPDTSGRRKPIPIAGSETTLDVDTVISAIGRTPNPIIQNTTKGLETTAGGIIIVDKETGKTSIDAVYAGGDIATGEATVISAMESGKKAAQSIHEYLSQKP